MLQGQEEVAVTPRQAYEGLVAQRDVLESQLRVLERTRGRVSNDLRRDDLVAADRGGLEQRLAQIDQQIAAVGISIREVDAQIATSAAVPGAVVTPPPAPQVVRQGPQPEMVIFFTAVVSILLLPMIIARAARIWKGGTPPAKVPPELGERLKSMESAIDTIALEVERIGEGQRFVSQIMAKREQDAIPPYRKPD